jgi:hypothetical protein
MVMVTPASIARALSTVNSRLVSRFSSLIDFLLGDDDFRKRATARSRADVKSF